MYYHPHHLPNPHVNEKKDNMRLFQFCSQMSKTAEHYSQQIQNFTESVTFNLKSRNHNIFSTIQVFSFLSKSETTTPACYKRITKGVRCESCGNQQAIVCRECFDKGNHEGHMFQIVECKLGFCCCGDWEKWKGPCPHHGDKVKGINLERASEMGKSIKFLFFFMFELEKFIISLDYPLVYSKMGSMYASSLFRFMSIYNEGSVPSNQVTSRGLTEPFKKFQCGFKSDFVGKAVIDLLGEKKSKYVCFSQEWVFDLYMKLFHVEAWREELIIRFLSDYDQDNPLYDLAPQILNCPQTFLSLLQAQKLPLFNRQLKKHLPCKVQAQKYINYFKHFNFITLFPEQIACKILVFQFSAEMWRMCEYVHFFTEKFSEANICYQVENQYIKLLCRCLKLIKNQKQVFIKICNNCIRELRAIVQQNQNNIHSFQNLLLGFQRTFTICCFYLGYSFQENLNRQSFLITIGIDMTKDETFIKNVCRTMQKIMEVYCQIFSGSEEGKSFLEIQQVLDSNPLILSVDMLLFKFLFSTLQRMNRVDFVQLFRPMFVEITYFFKKKQALFQLGSIKKGKKRKSIMKKFTQFVGILIEILLTDHSLITFEIQFDLVKQKSWIYFYGSLLSSIQPVKLSQFKAVINMFANYPLELDKFIETCTKSVDGKISLKQGVKERAFCLSGFHLGYFTTKKIPQKLNQIGFFTPKIKLFNQVPQIFNQQLCLINQVFRANENNEPSEVLLMFAEVAHQYLNLFEEKPEFINVDFPLFELYIQKMIMISKLCFGEDCIEGIVDKVGQLPEIYNNFSPQIQKNFEELIIEDECPVKIQIEKKYAFEEKKKKKHQKMNQKTQKFLNNNTIYNQVETTQSENKRVCTICRIEKKNPLMLMCSLHKSDFLGKKYLKSNRTFYFISTCGHPIHLQCFQKSYKDSDEYFLCTLCKSMSNLILPIQNYGNKNSHALGKLLRSNLSSAVNTLEQTDIQIKYENNVLKKTKGKILSFEDKLIESLSLSLLHGILLDPQFYENNLFQLHYHILNLIIGQKVDPDKIWESIQEQIKKYQEEGNIFWHAFIYITDNILQFIKASPKDSKREKESFSQLPGSLQKSLFFFCSRLFSKKYPKSIDSKLFPHSFDRTQIFALPRTLSQLRSHIGRCNYCSHMSSQILICVLCKFKTCLGCSKLNEKQHTAHQHPSGAIFIEVSNGNLLYCARRTSCWFQSPYLNMYGERYRKGQNRQKYFLCPQALFQIKKHVIRHKIYEKIREKQRADQYVDI